jgi:hypothetical protein
MAEQQELRARSTRARINATSFVNSYEWGDFKGNPSRLGTTPLPKLMLAWVKCQTA